MKKKILSLAILLALTSCGYSNNPEDKPDKNPDDNIDDKEDVDLENSLNTLKEGFSIDQLVTVSSSSSNISYILHYEVNDTNYLFKRYRAKTPEEGKPNKSELVSYLDLSYDPKDSNKTLSIPYLNTDNTLSYVPIYEEDTSSYSFENLGFKNFFTYLSVKDFTKNNKEYELNLDSLKNRLLKDSIVTQVTGSIVAYEVNYFKLNVNGNEPKGYVLELETTEDNVVYTLKYEGTFLKFGKDVVSTVAPFKGEVDKVFEEKMKALQKEDFTFDYQEYVLGSGSFVPYFRYIGESDGGKAIHYLVKSEDGTKDDSLVNDVTRVQIAKAALQEVKEINGNYYPNGEPYKYNLLTEVLPTFKFSSLLFAKKKDGKTYVLKSAIDRTYLYSRSFNPFTSYNLNNFEITLNDDGSVTFSNDTMYQGDRVKEVITYSNIGEVGSIVDLSKLKKDNSGLNWADLLEDSALHTNFKNEFGDEALSTMPLPPSYSSKFKLFQNKSGAYRIGFVSSQKVDHNNLYNDYQKILKDKESGFTEISDTNDETLGKISVYQKTLSDGRIFQLELSLFYFSFSLYPTIIDGK